MAVSLWKALRVITFFSTLPVRLGAMMLYYIPRSLRQHPEWSYQNALATAFAHKFINFLALIRYTPDVSLEAGKDAGRFIVLKPARAEKYRDVLDDPAIRPVDIGGMWYPVMYDKTRHEGLNVVIHFHGGAYVLGGVRPMDGGWGPDLLAKHMSGLAFCPQYRLASHPNSHFPAALQDAVSSYNYLLELGIPASQIIFSGDSAGANLALALIRYIKLQEGILPNPRACFAWSPWLDVSMTPEALERNRNYKSDYIPPSFLVWGIDAFKPASMNATDAYLSPLNNEDSTTVPIFVHSGALEIMYDDHVKFVQNMKEIQGNKIELFATVNAPHDIFSIGNVLGFTKETETAIDASIAFLNRQE